MLAVWLYITKLQTRELAVLYMMTCNHSKIRYTMHFLRAQQLHYDCNRSRKMPVYEMIGRNSPIKLQP